MTTSPTIQTNPLDPVFSGVPVVIPQGGLVNPTWNKWFVDLREKVNVINSTLAAWSGITPSGITAGTYGDSTHYPVVTVNEFGLVTAITVQNVSGGGGSPRHVTNVTSTYTITAADIPAASSYRGLVSITNASANQVNLDTFANTSIPVGSDLVVFQNGAGATTLSGLPGVTLLGPSITGGGQYSSGKAIQIATDTWIISGNLAWSSGPPTTFSAYALSLSPVAYWRMNETSGTTLTDAIGGKVATLSGSYTLNQAGMVSGGASVLFSGGYADTSASTTWSLGSGDFSMFIIGKWVTTTSPSCLIYIRGGGTLLGSFNCNRLSAGDAETEGWYWSSGGQIATTGTSHNDGNPHALCCTFVSSTNTLSFYFDGSLVGSTVVGAGRPSGASLTVYIANNSDVQMFSGSLAELLLFNYALTSTEIGNLASYVL